jgi:hypothetical protein
MTRQATKTAMADVAAETTYFATAGKQLALDTLLVEMGALKALLPGLTALQANTQGSGIDHRVTDAEQEAMFDNMPV